MGGNPRASQPQDVNPDSNAAAARAEVVAGHILNVHLDPVGMGAVEGDGIDCPDGECREVYTDGSAPTLTASPAAGHEFGGD